MASKLPSSSPSPSPNHSEHETLDLQAEDCIHRTTQTSEPPLEQGSRHGEHLNTGELIVVRTPPSTSKDVDDEDSSEPIEFDVVIVPGIYGNGGPSSEWSIWNRSCSDALRSRVLGFNYDGAQLLAERQSLRAINDCALGLLHHLLKLRENECQKRPIILIGYDIGGIVVKDALVAAARSPATYGDILDYSRLLIYHGCPHRSIDHRDMEDKLCRFLFAQHESEAAKVHPFLPCVGGLAAAVVQINGLFIESKTYLRSYVISLHADRSLRGNICQSFDSFTGALGVPFERQIAESPNDYQHEALLLEHLRRLGKHLVPNAATLTCERFLLSQASPVPPFKTSRPIDNWNDATGVYQNWLNNPESQILIIYGDAYSAREAVEQIFYSLDYLSRPKDICMPVLFFSFDKFDIRYNSTKEMLSTFVAQICCHHPSLADFFERAFDRLNNRVDNWIELELLGYLKTLQQCGPIDGISYIISGLDKCAELQRVRFLELASYCVNVPERTGRIVLFSEEPDVLFPNLTDCPYVSLKVLASKALQAPLDDAARLVRLGRELQSIDSSFQRTLDALVNLDPLACRIIWAQVTTHSNWQEGISIHRLLTPLLETSAKGLGSSSLELILDGILRSIADQGTARRVLSWLLSATRPLTVWEMATIMWIGTDKDRGSDVAPDPAITSDLVMKAEAWFAGIIEINHNEIKIANPRLRAIFMRNETVGPPPMLWEEVKRTAHADIAKLCLGFLSRKNVQGIMQKLYHDSVSDSHTLPTFVDRCSLLSYAVQAWPHHFALSSPTKNISQSLCAIAQKPYVKRWLETCWTNDRPFCRYSRQSASLFPVFAGKDLTNVIEPRDEEDLSLGLYEATACRRGNAVKDLLKCRLFAKPVLLEAVTIATINGDESVAIELLDQTLATSEDETFAWPPLLLYEASYLGLLRLVKRLLAEGCPANSYCSALVAPYRTPIYAAALGGHTSIMRELIKSKADVKQRSLWGRTALQIAAEYGYSEVIKSLVQEGGAELEARDEDEVTALYLSSSNGHSKATEELLHAGADPVMGATQVSTSPSWVPLSVAAHSSSGKCVKLLLEHNANPNLPANTIRAPLAQAALWGNVEVCRLLLDKGADPNMRAFGDPFLVYLMEFDTPNNLEIVNLLLEYEARVNVTDYKGCSALYRAVLFNNELLVRCLLKYNADANLINDKAEGPLYYAALRGHRLLTQMLLDAGANVNCQTKHGSTPLHAAYPDADVLQLLLEKGADPNVRDKDGRTLLMRCAADGDANCIDLLLKYKAALETEVSSDKEQWRKWTAISFAAQYDKPVAVRLLAEAGANLKHRESLGYCPLHLARDNSSLPALLEYHKMVELEQADDDGNSTLGKVSTRTPMANVKLLVYAGASLNTPNKSGDTPLTNAVSAGLQDVVSFFLEQDVNINLASAEYGAALHQACRYANFEMVKSIVNHKADVNLLVPGPAGTPLHSVCLRIKGASDDSETIATYLLDKGADVGIQGGFLGNVMNVATLSGKSSLVSLFLQKGVSTSIADDMGRLPVHFSAHHSLKSFQTILGTDIDIRARDVSGRTALHWAAQAGRAKVTEHLLQILPMAVVDEPDLDGWTPLCWAARGPANLVEVVGEEENQFGTIELLLKHGANALVRCSMAGQQTSPLEIASRCGAVEEVLSLLKHGTSSKNASDSRNETAIESEDEIVRNVGRRYEAKNFFCDYCLWAIQGLLYRCIERPYFDLCKKCHAHRDVICRDYPHHTFEEIGPEFETLSDSDSIGEDSDEETLSPYASTEVGSD